jgi:hypothetical protein
MATAWLLRVPDELLLRIFGALPAASLLACQCVCRSWRDAAGSDALWRDLTLASHAWLTRSAPDEVNWQRYHERLCTAASAAFVVLGGRVGDRLGTGTQHAGKGRRFSLGDGTWSDLPALAVERRGAALVRHDDGSLCAHAPARAHACRQRPLRRRACCGSVGAATRTVARREGSMCGGGRVWGRRREDARSSAWAS